MVVKTDEPWAVRLHGSGISDFRRWKDHDAYQQAFDRVLRDLKVGALSGLLITCAYDVAGGRGVMGQPGEQANPISTGMPLSDSQLTEQLGRRQRAGAIFRPCALFLTLWMLSDSY